MNYDKEQLTTNIKMALRTARSSTESNGTDNFGIALAEAIDAYIKTALESAVVTVVAPSGSINVEGTPAKQTNALPITITGDPTKMGSFKGGLS